MATRRKKQTELPKFIITTEAVYVNNYVIQARSLEEAQEMFSMVMENDEEHTMTRLQQCMEEQVIGVREAM